MLMQSFVEAYHGLFWSFWAGTVCKFLHLQSSVADCGFIADYHQGVWDFFLFYFDCKNNLTNVKTEDNTAQCCFLSELIVKAVCFFFCKHIPTHCGKVEWGRNGCPHFLGL